MTWIASYVLLHPLNHEIENFEKKSKSTPHPPLHSDVCILRAAQAVWVIKKDTSIQRRLYTVSLTDSSKEGKKARAPAARASVYPLSSSRASFGPEAAWEPLAPQRRLKKQHPDKNKIQFFSRSTIPVTSVMTVAEALHVGRLCHANDGDWFSAT